MEATRKLRLMGTHSFARAIKNKGRRGEGGRRDQTAKTLHFSRCVA